MEQEAAMNKDQVKGSVKEATGEAQEQAGKLVGDKHQELKGHAREKAGQVQRKVGDLKDVLRESGKH
jgi:uncharacterized protein YjbJ (UPF0337 family)